MRARRLGRSILVGSAVLTAAGPYLADWNRTHLFNPAWPPHARFHDAQSMLLGTFLGAGGLYFLRARRREGALELAAALPSLYWLAQGGSFAFPGARGLESEFPELVPSAGGVRLNERFTSAGMLAALAVGYALARGPATGSGRRGAGSRAAGAVREGRRPARLEDLDE